MDEWKLKEIDLKNHVAQLTIFRVFNGNFDSSNI